MNPLMRLIAKLLSTDDLQEELRWRRRRAGMIFHQSKQASGRSHAGCNNHGRGESKTRRALAARSNRINRRRLGRSWRH